MGKLAAFGVKFASGSTVFYSGDIVSGELFLELKAPMQVKAIRLEFVGHARVHWTETKRESDVTATYHYNGNQSLFKHTMVVYGEDSNNSQNTLPEGNHTFPFDFQLPDKLPSSYEDHIGHIRYKIKATVVKPWIANRSTKRTFTVLDTLDLNKRPDARIPAGGSESKTLCCWCCTSGPIEVEFHTDKAGYIPGENIKINATVTNSSNSDVYKTSVHLKKEMRYIATGKTLKASKTIATVEGQSCGSRNTIKWENKILHIPPLPPSGFMHCHVMDIRYLVTFEAHVRACAKNLKNSASIIIGTIPLRDLLKPSAFPAALIPRAGNVATTSGMPPPPSYIEAVAKKSTVKNSEDKYSPLYTYYDSKQNAITYRSYRDFK